MSESREITLEMGLKNIAATVAGAVWLSITAAWIYCIGSFLLNAWAIETTEGRIPAELFADNAYWYPRVILVGVVWVVVSNASLRLAKLWYLPRGEA